MRRFLIAMGLVLCASVLSAHEYDIRPVNIELKVESNQIRVHIESNAPYWLDAILNVPFADPLPATNWPEPYQKSARGYVEKSFQIALDGKPLVADQFACRLIQEPLLPESARVIFDIHYPIEALGQRLSGRAQFFTEHRNELHAEGGLAGPKEEFLSRLRIVGAKEVNLALPYEQPDFDIALDGLTLTRRQKTMEQLQSLAFRVSSSVFFWIFLVALIYQITTRFLKRREE